MAGDEPESSGRSPRTQSMLAVLNAIARHSAITQHDLAAETKLSRATVSTVLARLRKEELIERPADIAEPSSEGRSSLARLMNDAAPAICVDLGERHVASGAGGPRGLLGESRVHDFERTAAPLELLNQATRQVQEIMGEQLTRYRPDELVGVCVSMAAPLDQLRGQVTPRSGMDMWIGLRPARELQARLGRRWDTVPFMIENNANLDALAAIANRPKQHEVNVCQDAVLLVRWGGGIGGGAVLDNRVIVGARGIATEIGHTPLHRNAEDGELGPCTRCGHYCLDSRASGRALTAQFAREQDEEISFDLLIRRAVERDGRERELLRKAAKEIGEVVGGYVSFLNPGLVVISGYHFEEASTSANAYTLIADPLRSGMRATAFPPTLEDVEVALGAQSRSSTVEGGVIAVLQKHMTAYFERLLTARGS
ncbi:MAG: ROK family transcriptional regulator [Solirubrobacteraceae bacterium]